MNVKNSSLNARFVYVKPPSLDELEKRLRSRKSETEESIQARLETARQEIGFADSVVHDHIIINDDIEKAYEELKNILFIKK